MKAVELTLRDLRRVTESWLRMKRFMLSGLPKSAEGKVGHAVGNDIEPVQCRKAEQRIGQAGNGDRRPEQYPARGIKGRAGKRPDS